MSWRELKRDLSFTAGLLTKRPFQVLIQVTNRCNMKCSFCDFWPNGVPPAQELTVDDYRALEGELSKLGTFLISIEGGEPFLRPDLVEIVRILSRRHISTLYTNGWYVTESAARDLFAAGLAQVGVSIDYPDAARHDRKRVIDGAFEHAWRAVDRFRAAAPHGGRQVHVMTVLMEDTWRDLEALLIQSGAHGVGHCVTLLSTKGFRRGAGGDAWPAGSVSDFLLDLWRRYPHFRIFREYLEMMDPFLEGARAMPTCRAGAQSFNIDHVGNVSPCIEKIDLIAGNVRQEPLSRIHARMRHLEAVEGCQDCWTACRGFNQLLGGGGGVKSMADLMTRMRSS